MSKADILMDNAKTELNWYGILLNSMVRNKQIATAGDLDILRKLEENELSELQGRGRFCFG